MIEIEGYERKRVRARKEAEAATQASTGKMTEEATQQPKELKQTNRLMQKRGRA